MKDIPEKYKPLLNIGHYVTIWIFIAGVLLAGFARGVELEKQAVETKTRQEAIIQTQDELKEAVKQSEEKQDKIIDLLLEIKRGEND